MSGDDHKRTDSCGFNRRTVLKNSAALGALSMIPTAAGRRTQSDVPEPPEGTGARFYVSPDGNDEWNGKAPDHRGNGSAGPLATFEGARDAIRELKAEEGLPDGGVTVYLRGGEYTRTDASFELTEADSGTEDAPVVYRAYEDEDVRFIGGRELDGENFQSVSDPEVKERLPEGSRDEVVEYDLEADGITDYGEIVTSGFNLPRSPPEPELFVDGESMTLARWPNDRWTWTAEVLDPGARPRDIKETFTERPLPDAFDDGATFEYFEDRPEQWADYEDVWMDGFWWNNYAKSNLQIEEFDPEAGTITTAQAHHYSVRDWQRYYYYNVLDELDIPGEFYIDRDEGMLYLYSPEPVEEATIEISLLDEPIVSMDGVSYVAFRGLNFEVSRGSAVQMVDCSNCLVQNCTIGRMGAMGVVVGDSLSTRTGGMNGGTDNGIVNCEIKETGLGAVKLGGGDRETLTPGNNYAVDNEIHNYSRIQSTYTPAVWPTGVGSRIAHNHIYNSPHQAILIGGNEHRIEYNDIHDVVRETDDSGAIYMGRDWSEAGNEIRHNYLHHIENDVGDGQYGVYLDDLQSGTTVTGNVFYRVESPFSIGGGRRNVITNNVMVDCLGSIDLDERGLDEDWPHCRPESEGGTGVMIDRLEAMPYNEGPWASAYPWLTTLLQDDPCTPKNNTVSCNVIVDSPPATIAETARETGVVGDNLWTETPVHFVDRSAQQFELESDSWVFDEIPCLENVPFDEMEAESTYPDYALDTADVDVARVSDGRHEIRITVRNSGRAEAPSAVVRANHVSSGAAIGETATDSIAPGESAEVTIEWDTSGFDDGIEQEIRVLLDEDDVRELIEDNNSATTTIELPAHPIDLDVGPVYGTTVSEGIVELAVEVENVGLERSEATEVRLFDVTDGSERELATLNLPALEPDSSAAVTYEWDVSELTDDESRRIRAVANPDDDFPERNASNNASSTTEIQRLGPFTEELETTASTSAQFGSDGERLVVDAAGVDVWEDADDYGAAYVSDISTANDVTAIVKVTAQENTDGWAKAGLIMRNDVTAAGESSGYAAAMVTAENGFEFEWDSDANGFVNEAANVGESTWPCWLKLERNERTFTSYYSTDGETWHMIGSSDVLGIADTQDVALFATSHAGDEQGTAEFEEFNVTTGE